MWLRLKAYRQQSVEHRPFHKLSKRYFGPFKIIRLIGAVAYELDLPSDSRVHPVFHVSLLRRYRSNREEAGETTSAGNGAANKDRTEVAKGNGEVSKGGMEKMKWGGKTQNSLSTSQIGRAHV